MPKVKFYKKYGATTSKIERSARCTVYGHAADETDSLQDDDWEVPRTLPHLAARCASMRPNTKLGRAHRGVGRGSVGRAAGRRRFAQGMETAATIGGPETVVEQGQWSDWWHHHVPEAAEMDMAPPHDLRFCEWARGGLTAGLPRRVWTANWRCGENGRTTTNGGSYSRALFWQTSEPIFAHKRLQRSGRHCA